MHVVEIRRIGPPDVLQLAERPTPAVGAGMVRVRVHASGVNRADLLQRMGRYPAPDDDPQDVPGLEFAGEVESVGGGCRLRAPGDAVMGVLGGGGYADTLVVPERATIRVPQGMSLTDAGGVPEVFMTAWDALWNQAGLRPGETVLIHAVGSGVGTAALQLCRAAGARAIGTSRTEEKLERARALGLDHGVLAGDAPWQDGVRDAAGAGGVDVIVDLVGGAYAAGNLEVLASGGRWIVIGLPGGANATVDLRQLMSRRAHLRGSTLRARPPEQKLRLAREFERTVVPLFERGLLRPVVDRVLPASDAAEAHRALERNSSFGKLVLSWTQA